MQAAGWLEPPQELNVEVMARRPRLAIMLGRYGDENEGKDSGFAGLLRAGARGLHGSAEVS